MFEGIVSTPIASFSEADLGMENARVLLQFAEQQVLNFAHLCGNSERDEWMKEALGDAATVGLPQLANPDMEPAQVAVLVARLFGPEVVTVSSVRELPEDGYRFIRALQVAKAFLMLPENSGLHYAMLSTAIAALKQAEDYPE